MSRFDPLFDARLQALGNAGLRRVLRPIDSTCAHPGRVGRDSRTLINVSSNDYLGLSRHPALIERSAAWAHEYGAGSGASRLVTGTLELHRSVEAKIARFKGTEAALLFNAGWMANATVLPALFARGLGGGKADPQIFTDRLNHASLHHGCAAAGVHQIRFRHNDLNQLETLLQRAGSGLRFIVTESVFSMDGDCADVAGLAALADRYDAFLYLDEAHATGVLGGRGAGLAAEGRVDLAMGTFSKAFGSFGAYVAGSKVLCDYLVNTASGFIYATSLPPAVLGAIDAALDLMPQLDEQRAGLQAQALRLRKGLNRLGFDTAGSSTQIVPALFGTPEATLAASQALEAAGYLASAIRPPTVPAGTSRIRMALSAVHDDQDIDGLLAAFEAFQAAAAR